MIASYASPEFLLFQTGLTQVQHHLGLPTFGTAGCSDSKVFDQQAALEGAMSMMVSAMSGANLIHDVGYIEYGSTSCFEQVVTMDEVAGEVRFILNGLHLDKETLALEVMDEVGPGGQYVTHPHTLRHCREGWAPKLLGNRETFEAWSEKGSKTLGDRAHARVLQILETHTAKPLPEATVAALDKIIAEASLAAGVLAEN
jgi:trimethylamine--corrinoid protein Co-methyltransferase